MSNDPKKFDFETSIKELEALVARLEAGDLSLEDSLITFERGIKLTRECQQQLAAAEQKVTLLAGEEDDLSLIDFDEETDD